MSIANNQLPKLDTMLPLLAGEVRRRRLWVGIAFAVIALAALGIGMLWPKTYAASTTILVQQNRIIAPLMEGAATPTASSTRAEIARATILSHEALEEVLRKGGWLQGQPDAEELAGIIRGIKARTRIHYAKDNLLTISYRDSDAERTLQVTRLFKNIFIRESLASKQRESRQAFEFINTQVKAYKQKLAAAETRLNNYYEAHPGTRPNRAQAVTGHISQLRTQIQHTRLELAQKRSRQASLSAQLSGQPEVNLVHTTTGIYRSQLAQLQTQLDKLLLTYTDEYPDVVRTRHQIQDLQQRLAEAKQAQKNRDADKATTLNSGVQYNPLYQQLNSQLAAVRSDIAALSRRLNVANSMLQQALTHSRRVAESKNITAELTRDYAVNHEVYEDLLKRRERARISMQLDASRQGLSFRVKDPPVMPVTPNGLRLMHFAVLGLLFGLAVPIGLLFGVVRFDPRVRSAEQIERLVGLPVLADVPFQAGRRERRRQYLKTTLAILLGLVVLATYAGVYLAKLLGIL